MKKLQNYQIYALVGDSYVYVGKTGGKSLKPIRWKHLRGENHYTKNHFLRSSPTEPQIFPLVQVRTDFSMAYRYVVAFVRMFLDEGYILLNSPGVIEDAKDIHPMTANILKELKSIPLSRYLMTIPDEQKQCLEDFHVADVPIHSKKAEERASEKVTVRFTPSEKQQFDEFVNYTGVSQRQALMLLLSKAKYDDWSSPDFSCEEYVRIFLSTYKEEIARQEKEIAALKAKLKESEKGTHLKQKASEHLVRVGIGMYFRHLRPTNPDSPALEQNLYQLFLQNQSDRSPYTFPSTEDFFLFHPESVMLGKGRSAPLFVAGKDDQGVNTILRYYPRDSFAGLSFTSETFGKKDSTWLVRAERSKDGAMDLAFSFPLDVGHLLFTPAEEEIEEEEESQLDDLLKAAWNRSKGRY